MNTWRDNLIACALLRDVSRDIEREAPIPVPSVLLELWEAQRALWHVCHRFMSKVAA